MMETNMNLTFPIADWFFGTSDLERGLLGHLFNGYDTRYLKRPSAASRNARTRPPPPPWATIGISPPQPSPSAPVPSDVKAIVSALTLLVAIGFAFWERGTVSPSCSGS